MSLCALCARTHGSCCVGRDVFLTSGDIERIRAATGRQDFVEYRRPTNLSYLDQEDDPNWNLYTVLPDGRRRVIRRGGSADCLFLGRQGCALAPAVRPLVCRLFPVAFTELGITGIEEECASRFLRRGKTHSFLLSIGMDLEAAERWRGQLYRELREEYRQAHERQPA